MIRPIVQSLYLPGKLPEADVEPPSGVRKDTAAATAASQTGATRSTGFGQELSEEEQKQVEDLKRIDRHVRAHEAAHQSAAGGLARGKSFTYSQGPDGNQYAVAGEVQIDMAAVPGNPQATIAKMQRVRAAALAPSDPSPQDRQVAAQAARTEADARAELQEQQAAGTTEQAQESRPGDTTASRTRREDPSQSKESDSASNGRFADVLRRFAPPSFSGTVFNTRA